MKRLVISLFMFIHATVFSQVVVVTGLKPNLDYVYEIVSGDSVLRDSITTVFSNNHSYGVSGRLIYYAYEVRNVQGKLFIAINTLRLPDEGCFVPMGLRGIKETDFPLLFQYGIKVKATSDGFLLTFDHGGISSITYSYEDFRFEDFVSLLNCISNYLKEGHN